MNMYHKYAVIAFVVLVPSVTRASLTDGLVGHYELNGSTADSSGFNNDGIAMGATPSSDRFGTPNGAYFFDGIGDYIHIPESAAFDSTAFSISLWFRAESFPVGAAMLISKGQNNFEIHTAASTGPSAMKFLPRFVEHGVIMDWYTPADTYSLVEWTHVVGVYDPGIEIRFYVDGVEVPLSGPLALLNAPDNLLDARLGARTDDTLFFHGDIDDVRIYNRVLSASEAEQLFSAVPEPTTFALWLLGLAAIGIRHRRNTGRSFNT